MVKSKFRHNHGVAPPGSHRKAFNRRSRFHDRLGKGQEVQSMDAQKLALNELLFTDRDNLGNVLRKHWQQDESRRWAKANVKIVSLGPGSFHGADQLSSIIDRLKRQYGSAQKNDEGQPNDVESMGGIEYHNGDSKQAMAMSSSSSYDSYVMADYKSDVKQDMNLNSGTSSSPFLVSSATFASAVSPSSVGVSLSPSGNAPTSSPSPSSSSCLPLQSQSQSSLPPQSKLRLSSSATPFIPSPPSSSSSLRAPPPPPQLTSSAGVPTPSTASHVQHMHVMDEKTLTQPHQQSLHVDLVSPTSASSSSSSSTKSHKPARRLLSLRTLCDLKPNDQQVSSPSSPSPQPASPASFIEPGCFVALDIDDTLLHTRHSPSFLLSDFGVRMFQQYTHKRFTDFSVKNQHCRRLQNALKDKVTVEPTTADVVRYLQDKGCWVFALTARFSEMAESTKRSLLSVGIDMTRTSPFPKQVIQDPETHTVCREGVIYCNSMDKGIILNRFLENVVFFSLIEQTTKQKAMMMTSPSAPGCNLTPPGFIFVDDNAAHAHAILTNLKVCDTLSIPITCYHYTPFNDDHGAAWDMPQLGSLTSPTSTAIPTMDTNLQHNSIVLQILQKQMQVFVDENKVLTNREAYQQISNKNQTASNATADKHFFHP